MACCPWCLYTKVCCIPNCFIDMFKGAVSPRFSATRKSKKGVGINLKSTNSCLAMLKCTVLVTKLFKTGVATDR